MAYTPTVWETGDIITAEKLNKAENGIKDAYPLLVNIVYVDDVGTLDKTFAEIKAAALAGIPVSIIEYMQYEGYYCYFLDMISDDDAEVNFIKIHRVSLEDGATEVLAFKYTEVDGVLTADNGGT